MIGVDLIGLSKMFFMGVPVETMRIVIVLILILAILIPELSGRRRRLIVIKN